MSVRTVFSLSNCLSFCFSDVEMSELVKFEVGSSAMMHRNRKIVYVYMERVWGMRLAQKRRKQHEAVIR